MLHLRFYGLFLWPDVNLPALLMMWECGKICTRVGAMNYVNLGSGTIIYTTKVLRYNNVENQSL